MTEQHTIRIALGKPEELFAASDYAPLEGRFERLTGMERLVTGMEEAPRDARRVIEIVLPLTNAETEETIRQAIVGYCKAEIEDARFLMRVTRKRGMLALRVGLPILAACLALSTAVAAWRNDGIGSLLSNSFIIAGWVALWQPAELLLYDWWPPFHRINLLKRIADAEVRLVASQGG